MEWRSYDVHGKDGVGTIYMTNFTPFRPYHVDPSYYCAARNEFTIDEWVDILLAGIDYNPKGFRDISQSSLCFHGFCLLSNRVSISSNLPPRPPGNHMFTLSFQSMGGL